MPWLRSRTERSTGRTTWALEWREGGRHGKTRSRQLGAMTEAEANLELAAEKATAEGPRMLRTNWDARVKTLVAQLRAALIARERDRLEARVDAMVSGLLKDVAPATARRPGRPARAVAAPVAPRPVKRGAYKRTAAQREAAAERMRRRWEAKRKGETEAK